VNIYYTVVVVDIIVSSAGNGRSSGMSNALDRILWYKLDTRSRYLSCLILCLSATSDMVTV